jgi:predicted SprT family Zn-dependent metalloprotease
LTRIDDKNPTFRDAVKPVHTAAELTCDCGNPATIWIRPEDTGVKGDLFICDKCGSNLARIIRNDLGHPYKKQA